MNFRLLLLGVALSLVLCAGTILLLWQGENRQDAPPKDYPQWHELVYAKAGQYNSEKALAIRIRSPQNSSASKVEIEAFGQQPAREIVVLEGDWVSASNIGAFESGLEAEAASAGMGFFRRGIGDIAPSTRPRIVILPSGVWPAGFNYSDALPAQDCLVYIGLAKNISLESGGVVEGGAPDEILMNKSSVDESGLAYWRAGESGPKIFSLRMTLDEIGDYAEFSHKLAGFARKYCAPAPGAPPMEFDYKDEPYVYRVGLENGWVGISVMDAQSNVLRHWDESFSFPPGTLEGKNDPGTGEQIMRAYVLGEYSRREPVKYYAAIFDSDYALRDTLPLGQKGGEGALVGAFAISQWPKSDFAIVEVQDQFARTYARAFVSLPKYSAQLAGAAADERRFEITKGGQAVEDGQILARLAGSQNWANASVHNGEVALASQWKEGKNEVEFRAGESEFSYSWEDSGRTIAAMIARSVVWIVPLAAAIYFLAVATRQEKYCIVVEHAPAFEQKNICVASGELEKIVGRAASLHGIAARLQQKLAPKGKIISEESVRRSLEGLAKRGALIKFMDYYAPAGRCGAKKLRRFCISQKLRDGLIEAGLSMEWRGEAGIDSASRTWRIYEPGGRAHFFGSGEICDFLVFENEAEIGQFSRALANDGSGASSRIRLAIKLGKLKLVGINAASKYAGHG
ncbi:MAG: hypothetical protein V1822_03765 [Candidatus Micrarchaeota archaeon]